jgi:hypothetical protein
MYGWVLLTQDEINSFNPSKGEPHKMKKLMSLMIGLAFLSTTVVVAFADDAATTTAKKTTKAKTTKTKKTTAAKTTA